MSNPDLVLAVSMTKARDEVCGYPVIAQVRYAEAQKVITTLYLVKFKESSVLPCWEKDRS